MKWQRTRENFVTFLMVIFYPGVTVWLLGGNEFRAGKRWAIASLTLGTLAFLGVLCAVLFDYPPSGSWWRPMFFISLMVSYVVGFFLLGNALEIDERSPSS